MGCSLCQLMSQAFKWIATVAPEMPEQRHIEIPAVDHVDQRSLGQLSPGLNVRHQTKAQTRLGQSYESLDAGTAMVREGPGDALGIQKTVLKLIVGAKDDGRAVLQRLCGSALRTMARKKVGTRQRSVAHGTE